MRHAKFIEVSAMRATQTSFIDSEVLCDLIKLIGLQSSMEAVAMAFLAFYFGTTTSADEERRRHKALAII